MGGREVTKGDNRGGDKGKFGAGVLTDYSGTADLLPQSLRLSVPHDQVALSEQPRYPKSKTLTVDPGVEGKCRVAERAESDRYGNIAESIVDDFVPGHD